MKRFCSVIVWLAVAVLVPSQVSAQEDVEGTSDHEIVSRFQGSWIIDYAHVEFDEYEAVLGAASGFGTNSAPLVWGEAQTLEGEVTRLLYRTPEGRSSLEVFRNYTAELASAGFETLFECRTDDCGTRFYYRERGIFDRTGSISDLFIPEPENQRYVAARLARPGEGDVYLFLYVAEHTLMITSRGTYAHLDVVEIESMETNMVTIDADAMARDIGQAGRVALYGIFFETGSADITAQSDATLTEIATLLQGNPDMSLHIVGHTDSEGTLEFNMDLSSRRAQAVMDTLVTGQGIAAARLRANGVGYLAPVASNRTDEGRARNRRVELVEIFGTDAH